MNWSLSKIKKQSLLPSNWGRIFFLDGWKCKYQMMILKNVKFKIKNWDSFSNDEGMWIKVDSAWLKPRLNTICHRLLKGMSKALEIKLWQNGPIVSK